MTQSVMRGVPVPPFNSKPVFVSTLGPGGRGDGVGVTEGVDDVRIEVESEADVEKVVLVDETS
jgi:hypothetical protein